MQSFLLLFMCEFVCARSVPSLRSGGRRWTVNCPLIVMTSVWPGVSSTCTTSSMKTRACSSVKRRTPKAKTNIKHVCLLRVRIKSTSYARLSQLASLVNSCLCVCQGLPSGLRRSAAQREILEVITSCPVWPMGDPNLTCTSWRTDRRYGSSCLWWARVHPVMVSESVLSYTS